MSKLVSGFRRLPLGTGWRKDWAKVTYAGYYLTDISLLNSGKKKLYVGDYLVDIRVS